METMTFQDLALLMIVLIAFVSFLGGIIGGILGYLIQRFRGKKS